MKTKSLSAKVYAKDFVLSKARLLPDRLLLDVENSKKADFIVNFLLSASEDTLNELVEKTKRLEQSFELWFFEKESTTAAAKAIPDSKLHDFIGKSYPFKINSMTVPYLPAAESPAVYHVDIIFYT